MSLERDPEFGSFRRALYASLLAEYQAFDADADGDGWTNGVEYAFGGDPAVPEAEVVPWTVMMVAVEDLKYMEVEVEVPNSLPTEIGLRIESTSDLRQWNTLAERGAGSVASWVAQGSLFEESLAEGVRVRVRDTMAVPASGGRFFRIVAVLEEPTMVDSDGDGMSDAWETLHGLDPGTDDGAGDLDGDGLTNANEFTVGSDPTLIDSDGDGAYDGWEVSQGTNPSLSDAGEEETAWSSDPTTGLVVFTPARGL